MKCAELGKHDRLSSIEQECITMALNLCTFLFLFSFHYVSSLLMLLPTSSIRSFCLVGWSDHFFSFLLLLLMLPLLPFCFIFQYKFDQIRRHTTTVLGIIDLVSVCVSICACILYVCVGFEMPSGTLCTISH